MSTKRNDDYGYKRGARGIDGNDGEDFHKPRYGGAAPVPAGKVTGEDGAACCGASRGNDALQKSAKGK